LHTLVARFARVQLPDPDSKAEGSNRVSRAGPRAAADTYTSIST
jgi:hypothetical protein